MKHTPHFTLEELVRSDLAERKRIDNTPPPDVIEALRRTAQGLELVRTLLGDHPIRVSSGYRCLALNRALGSRDTSQHVAGDAADFTCDDFGPPVEIVRALYQQWPAVGWDQLILEYPPKGWVHVSFVAKRPRGSVLTIDHAGTHKGIVT